MKTIVALSLLAGSALALATEDVSARGRMAVASVDDCARAVAQAPRAHELPNDAARATAFYAAGVCHLYSDSVPRDPVAAEAWLSRAAALYHPEAAQLLRKLRGERVPHPIMEHCHDLGEGRKLCHGVPLPA